MITFGRIGRSRSTECATRLPNGPFQLTPGVPYDAYAASPVHRFYQAWQQSDCSAVYASVANPSGCLNDLFPWVEVTIGAGSNGKPQPSGFNEESTGEGATAMAFYNVLQGDVPYFKQLAGRYTIADNYHQPAMGGTGLNSIFAGFADAIWYSDGNGNPAQPPANQIENPNPQPGTNNYYSQDGYSGGSYSACADPAQPGVTSVVSYLRSLPMKINPNCDPGHYYLLNNYNPGYFGNGTRTRRTHSPSRRAPCAASATCCWKARSRSNGTARAGRSRSAIPAVRATCTAISAIRFNTRPRS